MGSEIIAALIGAVAGFGGAVFVELFANSVEIEQPSPYSKPNWRRFLRSPPR